MPVTKTEVHFHRVVWEVPTGLFWWVECDLGAEGYREFYARLNKVSRDFRRVHRGPGDNAFVIDFPIDKGVEAVRCRRALAQLEQDFEQRRQAWLEQLAFGDPLGRP